MSMEPLSLRQDSLSPSKPSFQTKMRSRIGPHSEEKDLTKSLNLQRLSQTHGNDFKNEMKQNEKIFAQTASKLTTINFEHLIDGQNISEDCLCGRHLPKFNTIKADLNKNTIYRKTFNLKKPIPNIVNHDKEYQKLKGPHLDLKTIYSQGFKGRNGDHLQRPKPEDLLKTSGPSATLSSYSTHFPGFRGDNQYVKPTDKHIRGNFPLRSKSTYSKDYTNKISSKDDYTYFNDQLRTGSKWFGQTTYGGNFLHPNPQYMAQLVKPIEKKEQILSYSRQYQTIYKNDYTPKNNPLCPSKVHLETKAQGNYQNKKRTFLENSDFKSLSPEFKAISTSKHSYV